MARRGRKEVCVLSLNDLALQKVPDGATVPPAVPSQTTCFLAFAAMNSAAESLSVHHVVRANCGLRSARQRRLWSQLALSVK